MELHLRVRCDADAATDLVVALDACHLVGELADEIAGAVGAPNPCDLVSSRTGRVLDRDATVGSVDVLSGDELVTVDAGAPPRATVASPASWPAHAVLAVDVVAGPDAGRSHLVTEGRWSIGRHRRTELVVDDPSVSRHHADLVVERAGRGGWRVVIEPMPDVANPVTVGEVVVDRPTDVAPDVVVGLGGTRLAVRPISPTAAGQGEAPVDRVGRIDFHRTPYRPPVVAERATEPVGPIPSRPEPRRLHVVAVLAPLAAGLMMYAITRQVTFLALTLVSPVVMVATAIDDRRTGRRTFGRELAEFRDRLAGERTRFEQLRADERIDRLRSSSDLADLVRRAERRTLDLWPRGREAPDFLRLRLGLGDDRVRFGIELDRGGDDDLRAEARDALAGLDRIDHVPVTVDLCDDSVLGVHGDTDLVDGIAAALLVQAATLHSPEDLTIVAAVDPTRPLGWLKWLPHLRSVTSPVPGNHLVHDRSAAEALVRRLVEVAQFRVGDGDDRAHRRRWPRVLLLLDDRLAPDAAEVSRLLDLAPGAGISVVWLTADRAGVPRHATRVLAVRRAPGAAMIGRLWSTDPDVADRRLELDHLRAGLADRAARALAPVRDASTASLATSIPRTAPLLDVLGVGRPTPAWVADRWRRDDAHELRFPIGQAVDGPLELDLVHDGPHALIGGTSGAGKSELLQSMVAGLATRHAPTRLNFLFVDYKGGASSQVFERLPHTVGYVTNLSAALALRALTSLRAELHRRMAIMEGRAKDLAEMLERHPDEAPASLVIVIDEFATLVKEVPDFVAGIIDVAQRGRSLGIHLVLATQRPSGSVNENILANTNLRISLRMLDRTESSAIIGSPDAADIPVPLRGRAFARLGPRRLVEFQSAYAGAPLTTVAARPPVTVTRFDRTDASPTNGGDGAGSARGATEGAEPDTQLDVLLDAIVDADASLGLPAPRRPWQDVLPDVVPLGRVLADELVLGDERGDGADHAERAQAGPGRFVAFGLLDAPEEQAQHPAVVDLETGGGWLVFGSGGTGKTTLLRTVAASISADASGRRGEVAIVAFDFASRGLLGLRALPEVVDVATGDDLEAVTRHLVRLDTELERRRRLLAEAGAEHLSAFHRDHPASRVELPRVVVLIDGFGGLQSTLVEASGSMSMAGAEEWGERIRRLVVDGRQVGIHAVVTADRRNAVTSRLHAAVANRLVLRHADEGSYAEHAIGAERARQLDAAPGRGLLHGSMLVQVACVAADPSARSQQAALESIGRRTGRAPAAPPALASRCLPDRAEPSAGRGTGDPLTVTIGIADVTGDPAVVDLEWSHLVVAGTARSGRSTALATAVRQLAAYHPVTVVGPSSSPLSRLVSDTNRDAAAAFGRPAELAATLERLANEVSMGGRSSPSVLVVDDVDALDDPVLAPIWERLAASDDLRVVMSLDTRAVSGYTTSALVNAARRARRVLVLRPDDPAEFLQLTGVRLPSRPGLRMVPGRGVLLADRVPTIVQVAV